VPAVTARRPHPARPPKAAAKIASASRWPRTQIARYAAIGLPHVRSNAVVSSAVLEDVARRMPAHTLLRDAADACGDGARYHRVLPWRAPWPISTAWTKSAACISPRRCRIARWLTNQTRG